ncbi:NPCBM/NEW2 domain-containing protein [Microbulbifer sp.]|uniref:NPCBM/NEW2 domain-containing protein n=1 Tax=Microbulbifer sp. TaxID=1908541 RepID=UPI0025859920|nr:NPCBM/NEW2 domain-containing protein [Microbulbifer sp.]
MPLCAVFFLCTLHWNGHGGDLGYWVDWMAALSRGYDHVNANYPPLLLHWFWLLAKFFAVFDLQYPPVSPVQLKFFALLPVLLTQLWLCHQVEILLRARGIAPLRSPVFWAVVASPALLLDGPVWGQVDLLPFLPMWLALVYAFRGCFFWTGAAFALALVWKFQAIVILPVLAGLFLRRWRLRTWHYALRALAGFLLVGFIAFLPFIWVGRFGEMFHAAYLGNASIFPFATFNAANLWYLFGGNNTNMHIPLVEGLVWATPHKLGLGLFLLVSVLCMLRAWFGRCRFADIVGLSMVMLLGFFAFAPSMHERYLFLMVPLAALGCARGAISSVWLHIANVVVAVNILLVLPMSGDILWRQLSWGVVLLTLIAMAVYVFGLNTRTNPLRGQKWLSTWPGIWSEKWFQGDRGIAPGTVAAVALIGTFALSHFAYLYNLNHPSWDERGRLYLSDVREQAFEQAWGYPNRDRSVVNEPLDIHGHVFHKGLGVHAVSTVQYRVPEGARYFHSYYGLNRTGKKGRVRFRLLLDGRTVWRSSPVGWQQPGEVVIPLNGAEQLTLQVDGLGSINSDHASWAEAGFWQQVPKVENLNTARR